MSGGFNWDPAGRDVRLAAACTDVRGGIIGAAREVLVETRERRQFGRRGYASALLGSLAAHGNLAALWLRDCPDDPDSLLLAARVAAAVATKALREESPSARVLVGRAHAAVRAAARAWPDDPTPWVILLGLRKYHRCGPLTASKGFSGEGLLGPWAQLERSVYTRDPYNREASRQLLEYFSPRYGGTAEFMTAVANYLTRDCPNGSPLRLLPLVAYLECGLDPRAEAQSTADQFNRTGQLEKLIADIDTELEAVLSGTWTSPDGRMAPEPAGLSEQRAKLEAELARERESLAAEAKVRNHLPRAVRSDLDDLYAAWFLGSGDVFDPAGSVGYVPLADISLLAHGLHLSGERVKARAVLRHLHPHASRYPWSLYGDPERVLRRTLAELERAPASVPT